MDISKVNKEAMQRIERTIAIAFTYHERYHQIISGLDDLTCQIKVRRSMDDMGIKTNISADGLIDDTYSLLNKYDLVELFEKHNELIPDVLTNNLVGYMFEAKKANDLVSYEALKKEVVLRMI